MLLPALEADLVLDGCGRHWGGAMIARHDNPANTSCARRPDDRIGWAQLRVWRFSDIAGRADDVGLPGQSGHRAGNAGVAVTVQSPIGRCLEERAASVLCSISLRRSTGCRREVQRATHHAPGAALDPNPRLAAGEPRRTTRAAVDKL